MVAYIKHIYQIAGEDILAIGNDFDGFSSRSVDDEIKSIADFTKACSCYCKPRGLVSELLKKSFMECVTSIENAVF